MIVAENCSNVWNRGWFCALGLQVVYRSVSLVFRLRSYHFSISRWVADDKHDVRKPGTDIILLTWGWLCLMAIPEIITLNGELCPPRAFVFWRSVGVCVIKWSWEAVTLLRVRSSNAIQVKGDDLDKTGCPGAPGWWLGVGLQPHPVNRICHETSTTASEWESKD
jgi:hypothetical protein